MTTYTDELIETMGFRGGPRGSLVAALKYIIEHGPSEAMIKASLLEADKHGYKATKGYYTEAKADYTCRAQCRALLAELEGA